MVDAISGAIYVIGGLGWDGLAVFQDVWASTDGGVDRTQFWVTLGKGVLWRYSHGYNKGYSRSV